MKLVFATHNQNKLVEVRALMPKYISLVSLDEIGCTEEIAETAETLEDNAKLKADFIFEKYGMPCFADDTGLLVDALNGAPGVYSARYAGQQKNSDDNIHKLLKVLDGSEIRSAYFKTVISLNLQNEHLLFEGKVRGHITEKKLGKQGFGYDPIFIPEGFEKTFAELPIETKNRISHRGKALQKLIDFLNQKNV